MRLARRLLLLLMTLLFALFLSSCAASDMAHQQQTVEGLTIALEWAARPRLNQSQSFLISLTDNENKPVDNAEVYLDLDMPAMPMGTNQPIADPAGNGTYRVQAAYTMTGEWEVTVVAKVRGKEHRATFDTTVNE